MAITLVFLHHMFARFPLRGPGEHAWGVLVECGWIGVDLFFVLSGFLITSILLETRSDPHYFKVFYGRRALRIFPVYVLFLVGITLLPLGYKPGATLWPHYLYLSDLHAGLVGWGHGTRGLSHLWSLALEEQFYLLWPLLIWALPARFLPWVLGALVLGVPVLRGVGLGALTPMGVTSIYTLPWFRCDGLVWGAVLAWMVHRPQGYDRRWFAWVGGAATALWVGWALTHQGLDWRLHHRGFQALLYTVVALSAFGVIGWVISGDGWLRRALDTPPLRFIGRYSYGFYLFHPIVLLLAKPMGRALRGSMPRLAVIAVVLVSLYLLTLALSVVSFHLLEARFLTLKRKLPYA